MIVISIISAVIAFASAAAAWRSSSASSTSANTAKESVAVAREQLALARRTQDEAEGPVFEVSRNPAPENGYWMVEMEMLSGPPMVSIDVTWLGESKAASGHGQLIGGTLQQDIQVVPRGTFELPVVVHSEAADNTLRVILICTETDAKSPRTWPRVREVRWREESSPGDGSGSSDAP